MIYQPEIMRTPKSLAVEEVGRARFEDERLVQTCVLYGIGVETPVWLAEWVARQFGIPDEALVLARNGDDVRRLAAESYLIASKKGTKWAIKRCLRLVGIEVEIIEGFGAMYDGVYQHEGVINHAGDNSGVFHVRVEILKATQSVTAILRAVRAMLPVRCFLLGFEASF